MKRLLALVLLAFAMAQARAALVNVALDAPTYVNAPLYAADNIAKLTDGNRGIQIHGDTSIPAGFAYWLDLGTSRAITNIKIWPRQTACCPGRFSNVRVSVHDDDGLGNLGAEVWGANLFTDGSNPGDGPGVVVNVTGSMGVGTFAGRWVKLTALADPVPDYALQVTEVEVFAEGAANLALGAATSSSQPIYANWPTSWLVNGSRTDQIHGDATIASPFAYIIDLGAVASIDRINILARQDGCCAERLSNYRVSLHEDNSGSIGAEVWGANMHTDHSNPGSGVGAKDVITADLNPFDDFAGRWVKIESLDDPVPSYALQIAEVEVYGTLSTTLLVAVSQPQSAIAVLGRPSAFTFNAVVAGGDPNLLTFQWKKNGVNIPGATSSTYTTPPVTTEDETNRWSCVAAYPGLASLTSDEAGLDINYAFGAAAFANGPLWGPGGWNISLIVDGYHGAGFAGVHGDAAPPNSFAYWFDMHTTVNISNIVVWPRQDGCCGGRLSNYRLSVHTDDNGAIGNEVWGASLHTDGSNPGATLGSKDVVTADLAPFDNFSGRWIKIQSLEEPVQSYALQVTEIEVFGSVPPGTRVFITQQPVSVSSSPFRTASFSVAASVLNGQPENLRYQWQRNGVNIPGATAASYTTPRLCGDDNGSKYRCLLSYPGIPNTVSDEVTLTFDFNYARGSTAYANQPLWIPGGWSIAQLVDGNRLGVFHGDTGIAPGFAYTVNLGFPVDLERIDIYPRQDGCCAERFTNVRISVHEDDGNGGIGSEVWGANLFTDGTNPGSNAGAVVSVAPDLDPFGQFSGQWIKLESLENPVQNYALQVTELEAIGKARALCSKLAPDGKLLLSWDHGVLQSAPGVTGPWNDVEAAASPLTVSFSGAQQFYRLRIP